MLGTWERKVSYQDNTRTAYNLQCSDSFIREMTKSQVRKWSPGLRSSSVLLGWALVDEQSFIKQNLTGMMKCGLTHECLKEEMSEWAKYHLNEWWVIILSKDGKEKCTKRALRTTRWVGEFGGVASRLPQWSLVWCLFKNTK